MNIHLSKPGGQREGPFTLDQINRDLAARKYHETDYWAWYEGLPEWVPLHSVPGVLEPLRPEPPERTEAQNPAGASLESKNAPPPQRAGEESAHPTAGQAVTPPSLKEQLSSRLPFASLQQIYILTTGDGPAASRSGVTAGMLEAITDADLSTIRQKTPRDVIGHCNFLEKIRGGGAIPDVAWRTVANLNPTLVQDARAGVYRICVRSFPIENGDMVTLLLFYTKQQA